jgi:hypothetical protein
MKAYIFSWNSVVTREFIASLLSATGAVETWVSPLPASAIVISKLSVSELAAVLRVHMGDIWFILVEATPQNSNGWLPPQFWEYITQPDSVLYSRYLANLANSGTLAGGLLGSQSGPKF